MCLALSLAGFGLKRGREERREGGRGPVRGGQSGRAEALLRWHKQPVQWGQAGAQGRSRGSRGRGGEGERGEEGRAAARVEAEAEAEAGSGGEGGDGGGGKGGEKFWRGRGRFGAVIGRARAAGTMGEIGAPPGLEARTSPPPAECHQGSCPGGFCEWMHLVQTRQQAFGWCPVFLFLFLSEDPGRYI